MPSQPRYQSRPSLSIGRQACRAMDSWMSALERESACAVPFLGGDELARQFAQAGPLGVGEIIKER